MKLIQENIKRCAIFLFYDRDGIADDYVMYLLEDLKKNVEDILIVCNGRIPDETRKKFWKVTKDILVRENRGFDVGGYREGLFYYGFQKLQTYDEIVMLNYTFFGPIYPFAEMFGEMAKRDNDFWGITGHFRVDPDPYGKNRYGYMPAHIQSHFLVLRRSLFLSAEYKEFIIDRKNPSSYVESICDYESIFQKYFEDLGFEGDVYCDEAQYEGYVYNPVMFRLKDMIERKRCPIIKRRSFFTDYQDFMLNSCGESTAAAYDFIREHTDYNVNMIWDNLLRLENMAEISRAMQLNYMLPQEECERNYLTEHKCAIVIYIESEKHIIEYKESIDAIDDVVDCIVIGNKREVQLAKEAGIFEQKNVKWCIIMNQIYTEVFEKILDEVKDTYEYVGILRMKDCEKNKPYSNAVSWQYSDWKNILPSKAFANNVIQTFEENEKLGMLIPPAPEYGSNFVDEEDGWYGKFEQVKNLLEGHNVRVNIKRIDEPKSPIGGSFWLRTKVLRADKMNFGCINDAANEKEVLLTLPFLVQNAGFYVGTLYNMEYAPIAITNNDYCMRELNKTVFKKYGANYHTIVVDRIKKNQFETI